MRRSCRPPPATSGRCPEGTSDKQPLRTTVFVADMLAATFALSAILAALMRARQTGEGQYCDVTLVEAMMNLMVYEFQSAGLPSPSPRLPFRALSASDGFLMITPTTQKNFESLATAIGRDDLLTDARFARTEARNRHYAELLDLIEEWTATAHRRGRGSSACRCRCALRPLPQRGRSA